MGPSQSRLSESERAEKQNDPDSDVETMRKLKERVEKQDQIIMAMILSNGIRPIIIPTEEQREAMKRRLDYRQGFCHIAVAGVSGSGKSSLINAFRGLRNSKKDPNAAPVGITETTGAVTRYSDPDPEKHLAWYDVPGAGTLDIPDWQYFTDQGLYVFNCILVVVDIRFTETDIAILRNCARFQIPSFIVRSKSWQHIKYVLNDMDGDDEDDATRKENARNEYVEETRREYAQKLERANLLAKRIYLVDKDVLVRVTRGESPEDVIDERALCADMLALADRPVAL